MKKSFVRVMTLVLALVMLLSLVACGGKQSTATTEADASAENGGSTGSDCHRLQRHADLGAGR